MTIKGNDQVSHYEEGEKNYINGRRTSRSKSATCSSIRGLEREGEV